VFSQRVPLDKAVLGLQVQEGILCHKVVVDAVLLAGPRAAGRVGDREGEGVRISLSRLSGIAIAHGWQTAYLEQELVEGALADARRAGDNDRTGIANCFLEVSLRARDKWGICAAGKSLAKYWEENAKHSPGAIALEKHERNTLTKGTNERRISGDGLEN